MRGWASVWVGLALALLGPAGADTLAASGGRSGERTRLPTAVRPGPRLPLVFERNQGQADPAARFLARPRGYRAFFTDREAVFVLPRGTGVRRDPQGLAPPPGITSDAIRMRFEGAAAVFPEARSPLPSRGNHFIGNDPSRWVTGAAHCAALESEKLWPGIDVRWTGGPGRALEYAFDVAPGADPRAIAFRLAGAESLEVDASGNLLAATRGGVLRHGRPSAWQESPGGRLPVAAAFDVRSDGCVGFRLGRIDPRLPTVIDPVLDYSTYLGGNDWEEFHGVAADGNRDVVVVGWTWSTNYPLQSAYLSYYQSGPYDMVVSKFAADGATLKFSTYLGSTSPDLGLGVAVDGDDAIYLTGWCQGANFPTVHPFDTYSGNNGDAVVVKLASSGASLTYSSYLGGGDQEWGTGIAVDSAGSAFVTGFTGSTNFPLVNPFRVRSAGVEAFVAKVNPGGTALAWSDYLGGNGDDYGRGIAVDGDGNVYVAGYTTSTNFPTAGNPVQPSSGGTQDAFVTKVAADGSAAVWSTYLGGANYDYGYGIAVDGDGSAWVAGSTMSANFPITSAVQGGLKGVQDAFVTKFSPDGTARLASTYLGGSDYDGAYAVAVDAAGNAYVTGWEQSTDFPLLQSAQTVFGGVEDVFVTAFAPAGTSHRWSLIHGGSVYDQGLAVAVDGNGTVLVAGWTGSAEFPVKDAFQASQKSGSIDGFLLAFLGTPFPPKDCAAALTGLTSTEVTWTDASENETAFKIERKTGAGTFVQVGLVGADATAYGENGLAPETIYTYRVRAANSYGDSEPSGEAEVTTPPTPAFPPSAPSDLAATAADPRRVDLEWADNSDNEDFFLLTRAVGAGPFATRATPRLGATSYTDGNVLPDRTYRYAVRAVNPVGSSDPTAVVSVTMPATLEVAVTGGKSVDSGSFGKDSLKIAGTLGFGPAAQEAGFDPAVSGFSARIGDFESSPLVDVPAGAEGWKLKKGKYSWKSPKGALIKSKVLIDTVAGTWQVKVTKLNYLTPPANPVRVTLSVGTDAGHAEADWSPGRRAGQLKFP